MGVQLSRRTLVTMVKRCVSKIGLVLEDIRNFLIQSDVTHYDESRIRITGHLYWIHRPSGSSSETGAKRHCWQWSPWFTQARNKLHTFPRLLPSIKVAPNIFCLYHLFSLHRHIVKNTVVIKWTSQLKGFFVYPFFRLMRGEDDKFITDQTADNIFFTKKI